MKKRLLTGAIVWAAFAAPALADETTFCNMFITSVPTTITAQGHYCFNKNLSTAITNGAAITINSDFVVLDLNNFKLGGGGAGLATDAFGIYANNRSNLTIRNGNIRGFAVGIMIEGTTGASAQNILVENNLVDGNMKVGINVYGAAVTIRNNTVSNTGGSTSPNLFCDGQGMGITNMQVGCATGFSDGPMEAVNNTVINTTVAASGSDQRAWGIRLRPGFKAITYLNRVMLVTGGSAQYGVDAYICRDNTVTDAASGYSCNVLVGTNSNN